MSSNNSLSAAVDHVVGEPTAGGVRDPHHKRAEPRVALSRNNARRESGELQRQDRCVLVPHAFKPTSVDLWDKRGRGWGAGKCKKSTTYKELTKYRMRAIRWKIKHFTC